MADSNATACLTCPSFNNQNINFREGNSLHDMFDAFVNTEFDPKKGKKDMKPYEQKFRKICRNLKIHLGSNSVETDIFNGIKAVMKRDFKEDLESGKIQVFVPNVFLTKFPRIIQYDKYIKNIKELKIIYDINELSDKLPLQSNIRKKEKMEKRLKEAKLTLASNETYKEIRPLSREEEELVNDLPGIIGERAEKKLFSGLKRYFDSCDEQVLVFYNLTFMGPKDGRDMKPCEKDFVLVNLTKRYIMPLEVKATMNHNSLRKAISQIEDAKNLISDWAGGDLTECCGWRFVPAIYIEEELSNTEEEFCLDCMKYIIHGNNVDHQIKEMFTQTPASTHINPDKAKEEFIKLAEYFLFLSAFEPIVTPSVLSRRISDIIDKAGSAENIEMLRSWTPDQLPLLLSEVAKVLFTSAPSTGKTTILEAKAEQQMYRRVAYLIPYAYKNVKSLLAIKMEHEWNQKGIGQVCMIKREPIYGLSRINFEHLTELIQSDELRTASVFLDELFIWDELDIERLKEMSNIHQGKHFWVTITGMNKFEDVDLSDINSMLGEEFYIPELLNPLRNSSEVVTSAYPNIPIEHHNEVYDVVVTGSGGFLQGNKVNSKISVPMDLCQSVESVNVVELVDQLSGFENRVLKLLKNESHVLVIVNHKSPKILKNVKKKMPQDSFIVHCCHEPNEVDAKDWAIGLSSKKFLIADQGTAAGFEFDTVLIVFDINDRNNMSSLCQRAKSKLVICLDKERHRNYSTADANKIEMNSMQHQQTEKSLLRSLSVGSSLHDLDSKNSIISRDSLLALSSQGSLHLLEFQEKDHITKCQKAIEALLHDVHQEHLEKSSQYDSYYEEFQQTKEKILKDKHAANAFDATLSMLDDQIKLHEKMQEKVQPHERPSLELNYKVLLKKRSKYLNEKLQFNDELRLMVNHNQILDCEIKTLTPEIKTLFRQREELAKWLCGHGKSREEVNQKLEKWSIEDPDEDKTSVFGDTSGDSGYNSSMSLCQNSIPSSFDKNYTWFYPQGDQATAEKLLVSNDDSNKSLTTTLEIPVDTVSEKKTITSNPSALSLNNLVSPCDSVLSDLPHHNEKSWFLPEADRCTAEKLLHEKDHGTFLIRKSADGQFALSVVCNGETKHCKFFKTSLGYGFAETYKLHTTLLDLVLYYSQQSLAYHNEALNTVLEIPIGVATSQESPGSNSSCGSSNVLVSSNDESAWFFPKVDRSTANQLLCGNDHGTFLIRNTSDGHFALSIVCNGAVEHCKIFKGSSGYGFADPFNQHDTLLNLVLYYSENSLVHLNEKVNTALQIPYGTVPEYIY